MMSEGNDVAQEFTEKSFWDKVKNFALCAGEKVLYEAFVLYYTFNDPKTPMWAKGVIAAAMGYFIFPFDAIPDITPFIGYADDLGALLAASAAVCASITEEHRQKATIQVDSLFGRKKLEATEVEREYAAEGVRDVSGQAEPVSE